MNLLHICSYYIGNKLYMNLIKQLSHNGVNQEVFIPIRDNKHFGKNQLPSEMNTIKYYYRNILNKYDKFLFYKKINKQMKEIEKSILAKGNVDFIHAHTVFSDGGTAYKIYKKYGINYIVNVRNTDINTFYKYGIHLRPFMYNILLNSRAVIFISYAYKEKVFSLLPSHILIQIESKCYVIPNGIDDYWHENSVNKKIFVQSKAIKLLFIGIIDKNKNLESVILTCSKLYKKGYNVTLNVVGNGPLESKNKELCKKLGIRNSVIFHGFIKDTKTITSIMDESDIFVMTSNKETFGLVYIEAMSRGIPVIYSKGQGIDGFFNEGEVGYAVKYNDINDIANVINKILSNYKEISKLCIEKSNSFNWDRIANLYYILYEKLK